MNNLEIITMEVGQLGTNCYLIYRNVDGCNVGIVVDPGDWADEIISKIRSIDLKVEFVYVTHAHFDHILAVGEVAKAFGSKIVMHKDNKSVLVNSNQNLAMMIGVQADFNAEWTSAGLEIQYIEDGEVLMAGDIKFTALHTPGHIDGCCCLYTDSTFDDKAVMITGDTLFEGNIGRVDFPTGSMEKTYESLKKILMLSKEKNYMILPGHGGASDLVAEKRINPYIRELI